MRRKLLFACMLFLLFFSNSFIISYSNAASSTEAQTEEQRETMREYLVPAAPGTVTYGNDTIDVDISNVSDGYIMVQYQGTREKLRVQITIPDSTVYDYTIYPGSYETLPLTGDSGNYHINVLEHVRNNKYALMVSEDFNVAINDEFTPFLYPNMYVWYTGDHEAIKYAALLSDLSSTDLEYVEQVYLYVTQNISYDSVLASTVKSGYVPDIDNTLQSGKGICWDYASLMAAMLRSQGIPTKLVFGYSSDAYHAWISVYLTEIGWVDGIIQFDGLHWSLVDPTLAANNSKKAVKKYIGDGTNYTVKYLY